MKHLASFLAPLIAVIALAAPTATQAQLKAGTAVVDISPEQWPLAPRGSFTPRPTESIHDPLNVRCLVLENGATRVVPGSQQWDEDRRASDDEKTQAVMDAGSVLLYSGSVTHGGGENHSAHDRTGINITYCLAWLRTVGAQTRNRWNPTRICRGTDDASALLCTSAVNAPTYNTLQKKLAVA